MNTRDFRQIKQLGDQGALTQSIPMHFKSFFFFDMF